MATSRCRWSCHSPCSVPVPVEIPLELAALTALEAKLPAPLTVPGCNPGSEFASRKDFVSWQRLCPCTPFPEPECYRSLKTNLATLQRSQSQSTGSDEFFSPRRVDRFLSLPALRRSNAIDRQQFPREYSIITVFLRRADISNRTLDHFVMVRIHPRQLVDRGQGHAVKFGFC
jgi:hypothetical protein